MNKAIFYSVFLFGLFSACVAPKEVITSDKTVSVKDYPYIELFHSGMRLKLRGQVNEAIEKFEACLAIKQDDDAVYYALSQLELMRGEFNQSATYIQQAAAIDPENTWYIQELAYMYYEQGNFPESAFNFAKLVEIEPRNVDWQYGYADVLVKVGEPEKAIEALNRTEDQVGVNPTLSIQKYNLYMDLKKKEEAINELNSARELYPKDLQLLATMVDHYFRTNEPQKGLTMLEELVREDPTNGRAHLALADVYRQQGEQKKAYDELKFAFRSLDVDIDTKMKILINIHESSYKIDEDAYELVDIMVNVHPNEAKSHSIRGDYLLRAEKEEEALEAYKMALNFDKTSFPIWNQVLFMQLQAGKYAELNELSGECLTLFPTMTVVYLLNGMSANQLSKHEQAREILELGVELVVDDPSLKAEFYGQIGDAYFGLDQVDKGKVAYDKALKLDQQSNYLKNNYAYRLALSKTHLDLAESMMKEVIAKSNNQGHYLDTYGLILFQKEQYKEALEQFQLAHETLGEDAVVIEHIGDAYIKMGNTQEALKWWNTAKEKNSKNKMLDRKIQEKTYYDPEY